MKKLLLNCSYEYYDGKYWQDSYIKNSIAPFDDAKDIHSQIKEFIQEKDGIVFANSAKPDYIYRDIEGEEEPKKVGHIYRVHTEDYETRKTFRGNLWVTILEVSDFPIF